MMELTVEERTWRLFKLTALINSLVGDAFEFPQAMKHGRISGMSAQTLRAWLWRGGCGC